DNRHATINSSKQEQAAAAGINISRLLGAVMGYFRRFPSHIGQRFRSWDLWRYLEQTASRKRNRTVSNSNHGKQRRFAHLRHHQQKLQGQWA
ncbi:hypothetical protein MPH_14071, partial [Macrophomina phaseolina MS6]